jgi:uncharacterized membrane protein YfcA
MIWLLVLTVGFVAGTVGAIVGFGGSLMLLPVLTWAFGAKAAVPIMGLAGVLANLSRVIVWWREVDWRAAAAYSAAGVPAGVLGAGAMLAMPVTAVELALGVFLLAMIPIRRWLLGRGFRIRVLGLALAGAAVGFLTGIVASTGPLNTPFFLAYGLSRGAFIATEAAGSLFVFSAKSLTFRAFGALPPEIALHGVLVGASMMGGALLAKRVMARIDGRRFELLMDALMLGAGGFMIWSALAGTGVT